MAASVHEMLPNATSLHDVMTSLHPRDELPRPWLFRCLHCAVKKDMLEVRRRCCFNKNSVDICYQGNMAHKSIDV